MKTLQDLAGPVAVVREQLEADLQDQCVAWMRRRGYWARKFSSISQRSVPDYLFAVKSDRAGEYGWVDIGGTKLKFFCEFKRPGTKPKLIEKYNVRRMSTEAQYEEQLAMRAVGWDGLECDDFEQFKLWVLAYEKEQS